MSYKSVSHLIMPLALSCCILSCKTQKQDAHIVSVSILPQKYFVEQIAGDFVNVNVMVPPGMNPATCDLNTEQLKKLYDSDICFSIGYLPFETTHLYPVLENRKDIRLVNHSEGIDLLAGSCGHAHDETHKHEGSIDPHIWLAPRYARQMAEDMLKTLSEQYPAQKETFETNHRRLASEIDSVAARAARVLAGHENTPFLIYHPALTYFAKEYGMEQISIEDEGKEPHPAHLKKIIDTAKEKDIRIIFIQNQFDVNNAKAIAKEIGAEIVPIDPLAENWTEEMNRLIGILETHFNTPVKNE